MKTLMRRWLALALLVGGLVGFFYFGLDQYVSFAALKQHRDMLLSWTSAHAVMAATFFMFIYIAVVAISIPGATFFTLVAGFLFGAILGTIYVVVSATIGSLCVFLAVRTAFEPWIKRRANKWMEKMRVGFQKSEFQYLLILRFVPIFPFWVVNIVPALLGVSVTTFVMATFIGIIPGTIVYVLLGSGLGFIFDQNKMPDLNIIFEPEIFIPLLALALLLLIPCLYKMVKRNK